MGLARNERHMFSKEKRSYHSSNRFSAVCDLHTATTVGSIVPGLATESSAVKAGRQSVGRERASTALHIAAVESRLARDGAASKVALIVALFRNGSSKSRAEKRQERQGRLEMHGDNAWYRTEPAVASCISCWRERQKWRLAQWYIQMNE